MKTVSSGLLAHLAQPATQVRTLLRVTRRDGQVFGFTDADADLTFGGVLYRARTGLTGSAIDSGAALAADNLEVVGLLSGADITEADLEAGVWDGAAVRVSWVNAADLTQGELRLRDGELGQVQRANGKFTAEIRGLTDKLGKIITRSYLPTCDADLGDSRCGVALGGYTVAGTVTAVTDAANFTASAVASAAAYFDFGLVTWTAGLNAGRSMEVKQHQAGGVFTLLLAMPQPVQVGDTFNAIAGCNKTFAQCRDKFSNVLRFRGYPHIPGIDKMLQVGGG